MRDAIRGYFKYSDAELEDLWANATVIPDANALLNLYRYSSTTRDDFISVLRDVSSRLWVPHQVAKEFLTRRLDVIEGQNNAFSEVRKKIDDATRLVTGELNRFKRHPTLSHAELMAAADAAYRELRRLLDEDLARHSDDLPGDPDNDPIAVIVADLFEGRVGQAYSDDELAQSYAEGEKRYEAQIPPGYKDSSKGSPAKFGDFILWRQILDRLTPDPACAIFITDDSKEDWWSIRKGKTLGPRPELVEEYFAATGEKLYICTPDQFMRMSAQASRRKFDGRTLLEVEHVSQQSSDQDLERFDRWTYLQTLRSGLGEEARRIARRARLNHAQHHNAESHLRDLRDEQHRLQSRIARFADQESLYDADDTHGLAYETHQAHVRLAQIADQIAEIERQPRTDYHEAARRLEQEHESLERSLSMIDWELETLSPERGESS